MAESIFKDRFPGYFELADSIVDAIERGEFVEDFPKDERDGVARGETKAYIVNRASLPLEDSRIYNIAPLMASLFRPQMSNEDYMFGMPKTFAFGATRHEGNGCFFFRWPGEREIDVGAMREKLYEYAGMFKEATPGISALQRPCYSDQIAVGPVSYDDFREFDALLNRVVSYNLRPIDFEQTPYDEGVVLTFDRKSYLILFQNEPVHFQPAKPGEGGGAPAPLPAGHS